MCGIAIIWGSRTPHPLPAIDGMLDAMKHRGPSGRGTMSFTGGAAGMVRLALVDLTESGQQPMWSADGLVALVFNGEMYNFREERARLAKEGHSFGSTTDTEVVLALYLENGVDAFRMIRGMFSLAILDFRGRGRSGRPKLVLARDPFGIKPLYVAGDSLSDDGLTIASELKGLLASGRVSREIDRDALTGYLTHGFVTQPKTMLRRARMVCAGSFEVHEADRAMVVQRYWSVPAHAPRDETLGGAAERLRSVLEESIALHAFADAPVGLFLSGGVDSTAIGALMRKHVGQLKAYTLRLPESPHGDESDEAAAIARHLDCDITMVEVRGEEVGRLLPQFARDLDQPSNDGLNTWLISRAAGREVRGVLSGLGGDEWFAGYPSSLRIARMNGNWISRASQAAGKLAHRLERMLDERMPRRVFDLASRRGQLAMWLQGHSVFSEASARRIAGRAGTEGMLGDRFAPMLDWSAPNWRELSGIDLAAVLDVVLYMRCQLLRDSDASSMASSLELRVPFVDVRVAEFSRSCRDEYKLSGARRGDQTYARSGAKRVLIEAVRDLLPPGMEQKKKRGFVVPLDHWMRASVGPLVAEASSTEAMKHRGLLDPDAASRALRRESKERVYYNQWTLALLELWMREVLDAPPASLRASASPAQELQLAASG
jgi:asparagine synthase (glutamine-hydrolysing)